MKRICACAIVLLGLTFVVSADPPTGFEDPRDAVLSEAVAVFTERMIEELGAGAEPIANGAAVGALELSTDGDDVLFFADRTQAEQVRYVLAVRENMDSRFESAIELRVTQRGMELVSQDQDAMSRLFRSESEPQTERVRTRDRAASTPLVEALTADAIGSVTGLTAGEFENLRGTNPGLHAVYSKLIEHYDTDTGEFLDLGRSREKRLRIVTTPSDREMLVISNLSGASKVLFLNVRVEHDDGTTSYDAAATLEIGPGGAKITSVRYGALDRLLVDDSVGSAGPTTAANAEPACALSGNGNVFCCGVFIGNEFCMICVCRSSPNNDFKSCGEFCTKPRPGPRALDP